MARTAARTQTRHRGERGGRYRGGAELPGYPGPVGDTRGPAVPEPEVPREFESKVGEELLPRAEGGGAWRRDVEEGWKKGAWRRGWKKGAWRRGELLPFVLSDPDFILLKVFAAT